METTVERLEAMFLKSEADLECMERRLKLDFINNAAADGSSAEENVSVMLESLKTIKAKHSMLKNQVKEITEAQRESMESIRTSLSRAMELVQHCQQTSGLQAEALTESEQQSAALLGSEVSRIIAEVPPTVTTSDQKQPQSCEYEEVSAATLEAVPLSVRSNVKLAELNEFYQQLQQHLSNRESLTVQRMKQLKLKVSDVKLRVLQHIGVVDLDRKGQVRLVL
ncbi:spindle and kinetochore-associated protein 2 [Kryptolebias marmoratus]|uniref:Protein FAM33A n=1 Tax=Kryptolebias marmoratus TaxID=37003 RepID=A0A3Q3B0A4_KRYMA|nr:spindle and kinetochore-associated protein 2 [Kryptolebias marmoratus]